MIYTLILVFALKFGGHTTLTITAPTIEDCRAAAPLVEAYERKHNRQIIDAQSVCLQWDFSTHGA